MNVFVVWSLHSHNSGTCVIMNDGRVTLTLSHPSERKQSFVVYKAPCIVIYLGVVALISEYRKEYDLTIEEALSHGLIHELSHWGSSLKCKAYVWNEFLISVIRPLDILADKIGGE